jgi:hypothetical protein
MRRDRFPWGLIGQESPRIARLPQGGKSCWPDQIQEAGNYPNQALLAIGADASQPKRRR